MTNENGQSALVDGVEKLVEILNGTAGELEDFAKKFETSDEEIAQLKQRAEINAGKTQGEIDLEDSIAAHIAAPLVNALDGISDILNSAAAKVMEMTAESFDAKQAGDVQL